jgi:hypothetical protein
VLSTYLSKEIFPKQIELLQETSSGGAGSTSPQQKFHGLALLI